PLPGCTLFPYTTLFRSRCSLLGDAEHLRHEAGHPDDEEDAQDDGVLRLGLDPDPVGALHIAAEERPHDAGQEDDTGQIADERVRSEEHTSELQSPDHLV